MVHYGMATVLGKHLRALKRDGKVYVSYNDYAKGVGIWANNGNYQRMICESQGKMGLLISFSRAESDPTYPAYFQDKMLWLAVDGIDEFYQAVDGRQRPSDPLATRRMELFASGIKTAKYGQFNKKRYVSTSGNRFEVEEKVEQPLPWDVGGVAGNPAVEAKAKELWLTAMRYAKRAGSLHELLPQGFGDKIKAEAWAQVNAEWAEAESTAGSSTVVNMQEFKRRA